MSEKLLEAEFLSVDLRSMFGASPTSTDEPTEADSSATAEETGSVVASKPTRKKAVEEPLPAKEDWAAWEDLLQRRLEANKKKKASSKQLSYDVETKFFKDFYNVNWSKGIAAKLLNIGEPLRTAIKVLGFDPGKNPLLAFVRQAYVQKMLISTDLLNVVTFKAIYSAVAENLVADSEFLENNTYNIIYCADLYKMPVTDMVSYLKIQKKNLSPSAASYTSKIILKNKKIFFNIIQIKELDNNKRTQLIRKLPETFKLPSAKDPKTKLNSITLASLIAGVSHDETEKSGSNSHLKASSMNSLVAQLDTPAKMYAALLYLSLKNNSKEALRALKADKLQNLAADSITAATVQIAPLMPKGNMPEAEVKTLVSVILSNLD